MVSGALAKARIQLKESGGLDEMAAWGRGAFETAYTVLPKTSDLDALNTYILLNAHYSGAARERALDELYSEVDWAFSAGTTAAFAVAMLGLACWLFHRRDY